MYSTSDIYIGILTSADIYYTLDSEPDEDPPEFTLTCRSEGGPATTVVWTRDGDLVQEDSNHIISQIIVNTSRNAVYNNTLTVRGREGGLYVCNVSNDYTIRGFSIHGSSVEASYSLNSEFVMT